MRHAEWLIHRGISLPRAPTLATTTAVHTRARHPESVTHVLGLKCHPCTVSHRPRLRTSSGTPRPTFTASPPGPGGTLRSRQRRDAEGTEAVGRAQPRSRASSPGETPAGDDCQKTCAVPSSWETPAGDDCQKTCAVPSYLRGGGQI